MPLRALCCGDGGDTLLPLPLLLLQLLSESSLSSVPPPRHWHLYA